MEEDEDLRPSLRSDYLKGKNYCLIIVILGDGRLNGKVMLFRKDFEMNACVNG